MDLGFDLEKIKKFVTNKNIQVLIIRYHEKASEAYVDVVFKYPESKEEWGGSVPIEYRRTGISVKNEAEIASLLQIVYDEMSPRNYGSWIKEQDAFWKSCNKDITKSFFEALKNHSWKCIHCELPKNPNWARRVQDLKEFGYTLATNTKMYCKNCNKNTTHLIMLPIARGHQTGYELISPDLRGRILRLLKNFDAYENRTAHSLLPDHKFPEIRWDKDTKEENSAAMTERDITNKFQLLSNQRNQQKREVCRKCYQTGIRGHPFGINFYYLGDENWTKAVPKIGKKAELGCYGCGWYDLQQWRKVLNKAVTSKK